MILSCNYSRLEDFDLWKVVLKAVPHFMYRNIVKFCSLIPNWTFVGPVAEVCFADFPDIRISGFANAAFVRGRGTCAVATQRVSSIRSFMSVVLAGTEAELAPNRVWNRKMPTIRTFTLRQKDLHNLGKRSDQNHVRYSLLQHHQDRDLTRRQLG